MTVWPLLNEVAFNREYADLLLKYRALSPGFKLWASFCDGISLVNCLLGLRCSSIDAVGQRIGQINDRLNDGRLKIRILLRAREDGQLSYWHAKLQTGPTYSEQTQKLTVLDTLRN
jgi:hypothetical protein